MDNNNLKNIHIMRWEELPCFPLYIDQVVALVEESLSFLSFNEEKIITNSMINNYVKHGIVQPPVKKKYTQVHVAYFIAVCLLKKVYSLDEISSLISFQIGLANVEHVYNTFCEAFEICMQDMDEDSGGDHIADDYVIDLFYKVIQSVVYKIYVQNEIYIMNKVKEEAEK